jgi:hypothetical protein
MARRYFDAENVLQLFHDYRHDQPIFSQNRVYIFVRTEIKEGRIEGSFVVEYLTRLRPNEKAEAKFASLQEALSFAEDQQV